ncbi:hypothetical protein HanRHA438_Chr09g0411761 [Helianthus annuus]|nr:hypothetical protein HanRHA438_Chr09g0411761 [Helianthus annuus]
MRTKRSPCGELYGPPICLETSPSDMKYFNTDDFKESFMMLSMISIVLDTTHSLTATSTTSLTLISLKISYMFFILKKLL